MASSSVEGILNMGGEVVPVINLRLRFGLGRGQPSRRNRVLVVERDGAKHGLLVDGVKEILELEDASILTGGPPLAGLKAELIAGIAKVREHLVIILEGGRLLEAEGSLRGPAGRGMEAEVPAEAGKAAAGREPPGQGPAAEAAEAAEEVQPE
jgi:purine-binding chemotaxis protein CheW